MSSYGDDEYEMLRRGPDTETADRLLTGEEIPGHEAAAAFVADARRVVSAPVPQPSAALARILDEGLTVTGPTGVVPAQNTRRNPRRMIEILAAKLAAAGLLAKTGIAAGALTIGATAAGATGNLPVVQDQVADAVATVGVDIPGGKSTAARDAIDSTEPGRDRGRAVSDAVKNSNADDRGASDAADAADGKADAGRANADAGRANADAGPANADDAGEAPVATPNEGGTDTAGTASDGASDTGTDTAATYTDAPEAGSGNADAAPEETPAPESAPVPEDAGAPDETPGPGDRRP